MDHPNIAKVLDGGTTETGRPFFVMEYVKGVPFTRYCDDARLSIAERLALFVPVCQRCSTPTRRASSTATLSRALPGLPVRRPAGAQGDRFRAGQAMHQPLTEYTQQET
jgi:hypothetical protein